MMRCMETIKFSSEQFQLDFSMKDNKQSLFVDALLNYGRLSVDELAMVLNVSTLTLEAVHQGCYFLKAIHANNLMISFLIFFGDASG